MTTYSRPGVFIEEYLNPLVEATADPSEASAAFVGVSSSGGPSGPVLVTSWSQYQSLFGGLSAGDDNLAYAVYAFFNNGGSTAYIVRALNANAVAASLTLNDGAVAPAVPTNVLVSTATAPGAWASAATSSSRVFLTVQPGATGSNRFDLIVEVGTGAFLVSREQFVDLSMNPLDSRYVVDVVNSPGVGSKYVNLALGAGYVYNTTTPVNPAAATKVPLVGGTEGTGTPDLAIATQRLDSVDKNLVVNVPAATAAEVTSVTNWAVASGRHFVVADVPKPVAGETAAASVSAMTTFAAAVPASSHLAVYGPWIYLSDPASRAGALRLSAPGGAVAGHYLRTDATRGVHKAPAGIQTNVVGAVAPYTDYTNAQQDTISNAHINFIKTVPGAGIVIWGARTKATGYPDRYIPVRRMLVALKSGLTSVTRFAVFEPNDTDLHEIVQGVVEAYLQNQFTLGAFKGANAGQAFFAVCNSTNNSPNDIDAGVINVEVGVALKSPAEFIIIRLGQTQTGTTVTDTLEEV